MRFNCANALIYGDPRPEGLAINPLNLVPFIIEPGAFRTDFNGRSLAKPDQLMEEYKSVSGGFLQWLEDMDGKQPGDPDKATAAMIQVVESDAPPLRLALGADAPLARSRKN